MFINAISTLSFNTPYCTIQTLLFRDIADSEHTSLCQASNVSLSGYTGEEVVELCYQSVEVFMAVRDKVLQRDNLQLPEYSQSWVDLSLRSRATHNCFVCPFWGGLLYIYVHAYPIYCSGIES